MFGFKSKQGRYVYENGDVYSGELQNGKIHEEDFKSFVVPLDK